MPIWHMDEIRHHEPAPDLPFATLYETFKAAGEPTRLRILALLAETELTVSDLTEILRQSQPRVSRHLKLLADAGLVARSPEGSWAFFRLADGGPGTDVVRRALADLDPADSTIAHDRHRLVAVRAGRATAAQEYFARHAADWDRIRRLHVADQRIEQSIVAALAGQPYRSVLDLGTGTGRMLELLGPRVDRGLGCDLSLEMLAIARANLDRAGLRHCRVRYGDLYSLGLPRDSFDVVVIHQVLHLLDDAPGAIREAAGVLCPRGRLVVVDFAPHDQEFLRSEHAHRRLGFATDTISQWMDTAGLDLIVDESLVPDNEVAGKIAISLWVGRDRRDAGNQNLDVTVDPSVNVSRAVA
jgi:ubiquinone/menaquinone biosynthesis C-methylase UbiE/DNA-binding transcriptional ArsR family regulator